MPGAPRSLRGGWKRESWPFTTRQPWHRPRLVTVVCTSTTSVRPLVPAQSALPLTLPPLLLVRVCPRRFPPAPRPRRRPRPPPPLLPLVVSAASSPCARPPAREGGQVRPAQVFVRSPSAWVRGCGGPEPYGGRSRARPQWAQQRTSRRPKCGLLHSHSLQKLVPAEPYDAPGYFRLDHQTYFPARPKTLGFLPVGPVETLARHCFDTVSTLC